jgi:hypothetical protein
LVPARGIVPAAESNVCRPDVGEDAESSGTLAFGFLPNGDTTFDLAAFSDRADSVWPNLGGK